MVKKVFFRCEISPSQILQIPRNIRSVRLLTRIGKSQQQSGAVTLKDGKGNFNGQTMMHEYGLLQKQEGLESMGVFFKILDDDNEEELFSGSLDLAQHSSVKGYDEFLSISLVKYKSDLEALLQMHLIIVWLKTESVQGDDASPVAENIETTSRASVISESGASLTSDIDGPLTSRSATANSRRTLIIREQEPDDNASDDSESYSPTVSFIGSWGGPAGADPSNRSITTAGDRKSTASSSQRGSYIQTHDGASTLDDEMSAVDAEIADMHGKSLNLEKGVEILRQRLLEKEKELIRERERTKYEKSAALSAIQELQDIKQKMRTDLKTRERLEARIRELEMELTDARRTVFDKVMSGRPGESRTEGLVRALSMLLPIQPRAAAENNDGQNDEKDKEIERLTSLVEELQSQLVEKKSDFEALFVERKMYQDQIMELAKEVQRLSAEAGKSRFTTTQTTLPQGVALVQCL